MFLVLATMLVKNVCCFALWSCSFTRQKWFVCSPIGFKMQTGYYVVAITVACLFLVVVNCC